MVLFVVTIVIALVTLSAYGFLALMQAESRAARAQADQLQVRHVCESGVAYLRHWLSLPRAERSLQGGQWDNPTWFRDVVVDAPADWLGPGSVTSAAGPSMESSVRGPSPSPDQLAPLPPRLGRFSVITAADAADTQNDLSASSPLRFGMVDESTKIPLHVLLQWESTRPDAAERALMRLPGISVDTAAAILDWIDPDDTSRPLGAESDEYAQHFPGLTPSNRPPMSLPELLDVRGVDEPHLFGRQGLLPQRPSLDQPGVGDGAAGRIGDRAGVEKGASVLRRQSLGNQSPDTTREHWHDSVAQDRRPGGTLDSADPQMFAPWSDLLTLWSGERNESRQGDPRIDLNQPDLRRLHEQLSSRFDTSLANYIVYFRQFGPTATASRQGMNADTPMPNFAKPAAYQLATPLDVVDSSVQPDPANASTVYSSPLHSGDRDAELLLEFCDATTVYTDQPVLLGRIDVNRAPLPVLMAIPGMDEQLAAEIVAARTTSVETADRFDASWLLTEQLVDLETMKGLWPFVCTGGDVVQATVVAYYDDDSPWFTQRLILDATGQTVRVIQREDQRRLGLQVDYNWISRYPSHRQLRQATGERPDRKPTDDKLRDE